MEKISHEEVLSCLMLMLLNHRLDSWSLIIRNPGNLPSTGVPDAPSWFFQGVPSLHDSLPREPSNAHPLLLFYP
jgi:hypothetical protein